MSATAGHFPAFNGIFQYNALYPLADFAYIRSMIASTYPNESGGITDWKQTVGHAVRTEGCVFFLCTSGRASVEVNMQKTIFRRGDLAVLTSDVWFSVSEVSAGFSARYVALSKAMIETAYYRITSASLWDYLHYVPVLRLSPRQRSLVAGWMEQTEWILARFTGPDRVTLLNNNVYNLFFAIDKELGKALENKTLARKDRAWEITTRFWSLLTKHSLRQRSVAFYANALHITPDYLNKACRRAYGISPKAMIEQQLLVEMKSYLADTRLPVAEIAERLNFRDTSYMCRFFRRKTGRSPLEFRNGGENQSTADKFRC